MARIRLTHAVKAASQGLDNAGRLTLRERSAPLMERPGPRFDEQARVVPTKSPIDAAIGYARSNWAALNRLTEAGYLRLDDNSSVDHTNGTSFRVDCGP